jgi:hypothetical protein
MREGMPADSLFILFSQDFSSGTTKIVSLPLVVVATHRQRNLPSSSGDDCVLACQAAASNLSIGRPVIISLTASSPLSHTTYMSLLMLDEFSSVVIS